MRYILNYDERVSKASELMKTDGIDAIVLSRSSESKSLYYLTGVDRYCATYILHRDGSNTLLILEQDIIDEEKKAHADETKTFSTSKSHYQAILEAVKKRGLKSGVIGLEKSFLRQNFYESLRKVLPQTFEIVDAQKITGQLRLIKTEDEIHLIRKASIIASKTIESTTELVKPGMKENEISAIVEYELRKKEGKLGDLENIPGEYILLFLNTNQKEYEEMIEKMEYNNCSREEYQYLQYLVEKYYGIQDMNLNELISPILSF